MAKEKKTDQEEPLEKKLWKAADKLRKNMDAAEYKHVVLGLIFLKYISDAFEELLNDYQELCTKTAKLLHRHCERSEAIFIYYEIAFLPAGRQGSFLPRNDE